MRRQKNFYNNNYYETKVEKSNATPTGECQPKKPNLLSDPVSEMLVELIKVIEFVNFRGVVNIDNELRDRHYQIVVVNEILERARCNNWGLCQAHSFIYIFNGAFWCLQDGDELKAFLGLAAEKMGVDKFKARHFKFRDELFKQFIALAHLQKPELSSNVVLINLKNGTFEITPSGMHLKKFDGNDFITYQLPFNYDQDATAPQFQAYLSRVLPDIELQNILSEYIGYIFIRSSALKLEKALVLLGSGANGKSVFFEIIRSLFGGENTSEYSLQSLCDTSGYFRAMLSNKLVNYASEVNGKLETSIFKQLVSGEPVEARLPYGKPFIMKEYGKLIFNCNDLPKEVEHTHAFFRRFLIIPFEQTIPEHEQDKQLAHKIISHELSGVFNWALAGLERLLKQKQFSYSEKVALASEQYKLESDSVRLFLDDSYEASPSHYVSLQDLFIEYRSFCNFNGYQPVNRKNFIKRLIAAGIAMNRKNSGKVAFLVKINSMLV